MDSGWLWMKGPRAGSLSVTYIYVFWVAVSWAGLLAEIFALHVYKLPLNGFCLLPVSLVAAVDA
uniref:Uncharacterized protein n=1 Tax=Accipiter nisus TaxID=211598 RepID=A0A8B9N291_9AVES